MYDDSAALVIETFFNGPIRLAPLFCQKTELQPERAQGIKTVIYILRKYSKIN
jgi:hypothetical protein